FLAVVKALGPDVMRIVAGGVGEKMINVGDKLSNVTAAPHQAAGNAPFEGSQIHGGTSHAHQTHRSHLLDGFHHHDGRRRVEQDLEALESIGHKGSAGDV